MPLGCFVVQECYLCVYHSQLVLIPFQCSYSQPQVSIQFPMFFMGPPCHSVVLLYKSVICVSITVSWCSYRSSALIVNLKLAFSFQCFFMGPPCHSVLLLYKSVICVSITVSWCSYRSSALIVNLKLAFSFQCFLWDHRATRLFCCTRVLSVCLSQSVGAHTVPVPL